MGKGNLEKHWGKKLLNLICDKNIPRKVGEGESGDSNPLLLRDGEGDYSNLVKGWG